MKNLYLSALTVLLSMSFVRGAEEGKHLFILSGQSNMAGLDPSVSFTPALMKEFGQDNVIVVKDAAGGQPIRRWYKNWKPARGAAPEMTGDLYDRLMTKVREAIKGKQLATVTFIWMQGEADARKDGEVYATSLQGLLDQLRTDLGRKDLNFVFGRISDYRDEKSFPQWGLVRKAQVAVAAADQRGAWVDTDDLNDGIGRQGREIKNDLHYSIKGYQVLGQRFAAKSIELIRKNPNKAIDADKE